MKPATAEKVAMLLAWMTTAVLMHTTKHFSAFKTKSAPSARSAFAFIVGLNRYCLLMIAVMVMVAIMIMMFVIVIVPVSITMPAAAFDVPPLVGVPPAVFPGVM